MNEDLPSVGTITYDGYTLDVDNYLRAEYTDVGQAAVELPCVIEWLNAMLSYYVSSELIEYRAIKRAEADAYFELKGGTYASTYGDKMTESALAYAVERDQRVIDAVALHAESKAWSARIRNLISTLIAKLELVRTVEATRRHVDHVISR